MADGGFHLGRIILVNLGAWWLIGNEELSSKMVLAGPVTKDS